MSDDMDPREEMEERIAKLQAFPTEAHWFCPMQGPDDSHDYSNPDEDEEDFTAAEKQKAIADGKLREDVAFGASLILGLDENEAPESRTFYVNGLGSLLSHCDQCVSNWHMSRKAFLKKLSEDFDDETISLFASRLNVIDFKRIERGLSSARKIFESVEPEKRSSSLLGKQDSTTLLALFEALCCVEYHTSEEVLVHNFNYVFSEVQHRKVLKLGDLLPASTRFLFQNDTIRSRFANSAWQNHDGGLLTKKQFEWIAHDALSEAIINVSQFSADKGDINRFWKGFLLILEKMDHDLITHDLRGMEVQPDIYHLGLQHLAQDSEDIVQHVLEAFSQLLQKSPKTFWSALGTISPATVAEQIFQSPGFGKVLNNKQNLEDFENNPAVTWIPYFINSLDAVHQYDACRSLLLNLLERQDGMSEGAKITCCRAGMTAIKATLCTFTNTEYQVNPSTSLLVINDIMRLVDKYKGIITGCADINDKDSPELKELGMLVIKEALALDCKAMSAEFFALQKGTPIQRGLRTYSESVWQAVLAIFRPGDLELAKSILIATSCLTGLDEIMPTNKKDLNLPKNHTQYNKDFNQLMDNISRVLERLSDFESADLQKLCQASLTARPLFAALVSANDGVYEATVEVIKSATGEMGKMDAIEVLLRDFFIPTLNSLTSAVIKITKAKTFFPVPQAIKIGREILTALCGSTGKLRTDKFTDAERTAISTYWFHQWRLMDMAFSTTESWAPRVNKPTSYMQDFCRDGMEYAEQLFDQYNVFASALSDSVSEDDDNASSKTGSQKEKVLGVVCRNVNGLTGLLRLRDSWLISTITSLLGKLLRCLGESNLEIDTFASDFIKAACKRENQKDFKKTNLTNLQKAELQRALEEHQGIEIVEPPALPFKKQSTIDSWSRSGDGKVHEPTLPSRQRTLDFGRSSISRPEKAVARPQPPDNSAFMEKRKKAQEQMQRDKEAAIAKARALRAPAGVRGEGSGLKDLGGVIGKDHAPIRNEIMVGSSSEESDDDDEDETGALIKTRKQKSKMVSEYEESKKRALKQMQQGPVRKTKIQRSAKDLRARVEPNMDKLYIEILDWDIFHPGDTPPTSSEYRKIADSFIELDLYKKTFTPLLISEVWRSLVTAKEENNSKPIEITVLNRSSVDKFMEVSIKMPMTMDRDRKFAERDIVLLSKSSDPINSPDAPHCLARVSRTNRKKDIIECTLQVSRSINQTLLQSLTMNSKIHAAKIADMTTTQREFAALSSLEYYDLCNEVLEAKPSPLQKYSSDSISKISSTYDLNPGQAKAILSADDNDGFTLIQGPPGSGKTKTIIAMVGTLLTKSLSEQKAAQSRAAAPVSGRAAPTPPSALPKKKLLICAPSNAAVDELVVRLKKGIVTRTLDGRPGKPQKINVIRIGRSDAINTDVKDVMLDELVRQKLEGDDGEKNKLFQDRDKLHQEAGAIKEQLNSIRPQMAEAREKGDKSGELVLQRQFDELKRKQAQIGNKIDEDKQNGNTSSRQNEINRRRYQQEILDGAHVVCATLSGSGHDMFRNINVEFETVIIDEAAQCIELSALIPLKYGCSKCILVGDPEQLPPTVLSRSAQSYGYEQSLFVRMQKNHPQDIHLLDTQYRMHPDISSFPSQAFYNSKLLDGEGMAALRQQPWHASTILGPYRFFDVEGVQTTHSRGHSFINVPELNAALQLYRRLKADYRNHDFTGKIGIITTYKAQLIELKIRFERDFGPEIFDEIEFNTTDAFQGREREIIIFSCVRAKATGGIGFMKDIRRMNVGLTRAKSSLWVLGDSRALQQGEFWNRLIVDAKARNKYTGGDVLKLLSKPTSRQPITPLTKPTPSNSNQPSAAPSPAASMPPITLIEDNDVEMTDAPSFSNSHKPSTSSSSSVVSSRVSSKSQPASMVEKSSMDPHGTKRRRESLKDEEPHVDKKAAAAPLKNPKVPDLDAALRAQEARKAAPGMTRPPPRPPGMVPRKRGAVDPFIQRKPGKRG
ncbi:hypothetical protein HYFRA_00008099 [Hymenoscyphus fraxineus]|uniref:Uncharacterized protein n=1 Tax=Hymenoscyphus fraxineus TaxID=746836 RepID=A0A9N9PG75_9HELO|nr:hypothetical protein HYFRA_00008099 [Hymenoscyphus fraxineus]